MGGIGRILMIEREGREGHFDEQKKVVGQSTTEYSYVLNRVVLCWRLNFNSFCTLLPMTFMFHRGYDCVKICLD